MSDRQNQKKIQRLGEEKKKITAELDRLKEKERRYNWEIKALEHAEKELARKRRSHRIFTRGAMLEGFLQEPLFGQVSRGLAGDYQSDERAGVARLSWRVSGR